MRNAMARARGVTVRVLDTAKIEQMVSESPMWKEKYPDHKPSIGQAPLALADAEDGKSYVLGIEGVGDEISDDEPYEIDVFAQRDTESGWSFTVLPVASLSLTLDEVRDLVTDEVDLADLIRVFGSRLESNFWMWHEVLS